VHVHLSESHRGIPGRGTVDWDRIFRGLADGGYDAVVGLESFAQISDAMKAATYLWRSLTPDSDTLVREPVLFSQRSRPRTASASRRAGTNSRAMRRRTADALPYSAGLQPPHRTSVSATAFVTARRSSTETLSSAWCA
jgi:hypothetical protein